MAEETWIGKRAGGWRIEQEIGEGRRARVFRGERVEGEFAHRVAIKLLRPGIPVAEADAERDRLLALRDGDRFSPASTEAGS